MTTLLLSLLLLALLLGPASYLAKLTIDWREARDLQHEIEDRMTWLMDDPAFAETPIFVETVAYHSYDAASTLDHEWKEINRDAAK